MQTQVGFLALQEVWSARVPIIKLRFIDIIDVDLSCDVPAGVQSKGPSTLGYFLTSRLGRNSVSPSSYGALGCPLIVLNVAFRFRTFIFLPWNCPGRICQKLTDSFMNVRISWIYVVTALLVMLQTVKIF